MGTEDDSYGKTVLADVQPAVLRVSYGDVAVDYPLMAATVTLGRSSDNTIVIPLRTVSRLHAVLTRESVGYRIRDQHSTNGLLYQGRHIEERLLVDGDILRISDELGNFATLSYHDVVQAASSQQHAPMVAFDQDQSDLTIGRAADNILVLDHPQVSAHHAVIRRSSTGAVLEDLGSTNGTFMNGQPVKKAPIQPGDVFQIGGLPLLYQVDAISQEVASTAVRLDAINLVRPVGGGALLRDISLSIAPRELVALIGGSGTGKSTLMGALNGFRPAPEGQVLYNGDNYYRNVGVYRSSLGYVPQDATIHPELTVERTLSYAARLRLPPDISAAERARAIDEVLDDVGMAAYRTMRVANLSGGQLKRVAIAVELLARPRIFFLDEPATGLDPGLEKRIMSLLRNLADKGCTIILVTHATANITMCDQVGVMGRGGRLCFYGPPHEALNFFGAREFSNIYSQLEVSESVCAEWTTRFEQSPACATYVRGRLASSAATSTDGRHAAGQASGAQRARRAPGGLSAWRQFWLLTMRYAETLVQDRLTLLLLLLQAPLGALIILLVAPTTIFADGASPIDAQQIIFLVVLDAILIGTTNAGREIVKERSIYLRERLVNLKVVPYVLSKAAVLALLCLVQIIVLIGMLLPYTGAPPAGVLLPGPLEWLVSAWLAALGGMAMGLLLSAVANSSSRVMAIVPLLLVPQIMLAGPLFELTGPARVLSTVTVARWATEAMGTTADLNRLYYQALASAPPGIRPTLLPASIDGFSLESYDSSTRGRTDYSAAAHLRSRRRHLLGRWGILGGQIVAFLALACLAQRQKDRIWQGAERRRPKMEAQ